MAERTQFWTFAAGAAASCLLGGCASESFTAENAPEYMITRDRTAFYRFGPAQPGPADVRLDRENRVRLLRREFGYSLVQIGTKQTGYVANEDMTPAPPRRAYAVASEAGPGVVDVQGPTERPYTGPLMDDVPLPDLGAVPQDAPGNSVADLPLIDAAEIPTEITDATPPSEPPAGKPAPPEPSPSPATQP